MPFQIRDLGGGDLPRLVELNTAAMPAVPLTPLEQMIALLERADHAFGILAPAETGSPPDRSYPGDAPGVAEEETLAGFVIAFGPGSDYASENYRFFEDRAAENRRPHLYVDRIVVASPFRGRRLGRALYSRVFAIARAEGRVEVTCEVNLDPPNPGSLAFHGRLGFAEVGRQHTKGGSVQVALLAASVDL